MIYGLFAAIAAAAGYALSARTARSYALPVRPTAAGAAFLTAALMSAYCAQSLAFSVVAAACAVAALTDLCSGYIFDVVVLPSLAAAVILQGASGQFTAALAGVAVGGGVPLLLFACTRGNGIGLGDVKLGCAIGASLGVSASISALQVAFVSGAIVALVLVAARRASRRSAIPFAPFLAAGTFAAGIIHTGR